MATASITSPTLDALIAKLATIPASLPENIDVANDEIDSEMRVVLAQTLPGTLAQRWLIEFSAGDAGPVSGRFKLSATDPRVGWYIKGTRPHAIRAHLPPRALAFQMGGQPVFARSVHHPGTKPHNVQPQLRAALRSIAERNWRAAIRSALAEL